MQVTRQDIDFLGSLATIDREVAVDTIPVVFKKDFDLYFFGKTLLERDKVLFAYPHDLKFWVRSLLVKYQTKS